MSNVMTLNELFLGTTDRTATVTATSINSSSRGSKITSSKGGVPINKGKSLLSLISTSFSSSNSTNTKKKQLKKLERKLQNKEQRGHQQSHHRGMLKMILLFYLIAVTTIVILYIITKPQHFYHMWSNASLAFQNQQPNMKDIIRKQNQRRASSSTTKQQSNRNKHYYNSNDESDFVEVGGTAGQQSTRISATDSTNTKTKSASPSRLTESSSSRRSQQHHVNNIEYYETEEELPDFAFQIGEALGVQFIQCSTIHGYGGVPPPPSASSTSLSNQENTELGNLDEYGIPLTSIQMPQSSWYSNDVIFLGRRFFQNHQFLSQELKYGGNVPVVDSDIERRAIYDYCRTAEEVVGYIDSIIILDLDHTSSTLYIRNILQELLRVRRISALPVAAIVTPEQSSQTILDWIMYGDRLRLIHEVARHWIPISAGPYILQTMADDESYDDDHDHESLLSPTSDTTDVFHHRMDTNSIGPSLSIPSSSIFRQMDAWPILLISGTEDTISQKVGNLMTSSDQKYHIIETTKHMILPGNTTCYLYHASLVMIAILNYLKEWEMHHPIDETKSDNDMDNTMMMITPDADTTKYSMKIEHYDEEAHCSDDQYITNTVPYVANIFPL